MGFHMSAHPEEPAASATRAPRAAQAQVLTILVHSQHECTSSTRPWHGCTGASILVWWGIDQTNETARAYRPPASAVLALIGLGLAADEISVTSVLKCHLLRFPSLVETGRR